MPKTPLSVDEMMRYVTQADSQDCAYVASFQIELQHVNCQGSFLIYKYLSNVGWNVRYAVFQETCFIGGGVFV